MLCVALLSPEQTEKRQREGESGIFSFGYRTAFIISVENN